MLNKNTSTKSGSLTVCFELHSDGEGVAVVSRSENDICKIEKLFLGNKAHALIKLLSENEFLKDFL